MTLLYVRTVGYTHLKNVELEAVILCKILIVFVKSCELVKAMTDPSMRFEHRRRIAYRRHLTPDAIADDVVADLYSSCHQRYSVVDILQDVLHSESDTCRQTTRNNDEPRVADVEDG